MEKKIDREKLCKKIKEIYPDIGECGINVDAHYDEGKKAWVVHLERKGKTLDTYLEIPEVEACMLGKECVSLAIQVGELKRDIEEMSPTRQS